jgi:hypothetical protein
MFAHCHFCSSGFRIRTLNRFPFSPLCYMFNPTHDSLCSDSNNIRWSVHLIQHFIIILVSMCRNICSTIRDFFLLKNAALWDVAPCRYFVNRLFRGTYRLHLQGIRNLRAGNKREHVTAVKTSNLTIFVVVRTDAYI